MKRTISILLTFVLFSSIGKSQEEFGIIKMQALNDHIYKIWYDRGGGIYTTNMLASYGKDGLLLIDTGQKEEAEALKKALEEKWGQMPNIVINTHEHVDHTGGNRFVAKESLIIGHDILRERLKGGAYIWDEFPDYVLPDIGITDTTTLYFNNEKIVLIPFVGSHDNNDLIVWFPESKIAAIGDLAYKKYFPSFDGASGSYLNYPDVVKKIIEFFPEDTHFVPGHYEDLTMTDVKEFHAMTVDMIETVTKAYETEKDQKKLVENEILKEWDDWGKGYMSTQAAIEGVAYYLKGGNTKEFLTEALYHIYKNNKPEKIKEEYYKLKKEQYDRFEWMESILLGAGMNLYSLGKYEAAIPFIELEMEEYPEGQYFVYNHLYLGYIYQAMGDKDKALSEYKKAEKIRPDSKTVKKKIQELEG